MCGIVGYIGSKPVVEVIVGGLRRLEYRGYDSAGIAVSGRSDGTSGDLQIRRAPGKLENLVAAIAAAPLDGTFGIGHTRWATHGRPTEQNAHPHRDGSGTLVVVHNGIIENHLVLKHELVAKGHIFRSETDTEIIAHLIQDELEMATNLSSSQLPLEEAVRRAVARLTGAFAIGVISACEPNKLVAARMGPPAVLGLGDGEYFLASDVLGVLDHTHSVHYLEDGELAVLTPAGVALTDFAGISRPLVPQRISWDPTETTKGGYQHFMLKEIHEQPAAIRDTIFGRVALDSGHVILSDAEKEFGIPAATLRGASQVTIAACGTSWHAGLIGKFMIERLARVRTEVDYASEFRYRASIPDPNGIGLLISQSGETADTLAAQRELVALGYQTVGICNVVGAAIPRETKGVITTKAGPEIGVASTKVFTAQLTALFLFGLYLAQVRRTISDEESISLVNELNRVPHMLENILRTVDNQCRELADIFSDARDFLFLGRGIHYPVALEGALKLKEISYIHAEGYPAGEMKHGPNALIDESVPVVCIVTQDRTNPSSVLKYEKSLSNLQEVTARDGRVIAIATEGDDQISELAEHVIYLPSTNELFLPILEVVPLQLLAYYIAVRRGCDVDQPRNLAKSVTVE